MYLHIGAEESDSPEQKIAARLGRVDRIRFCGTVKDVTPLLYATDVYVMPSLYEGCPIATIEAMGAGLPCILSDVPGLRDFKDAGEIVWVEPTADSIQKAITRFCITPALERQRIGKALSRYVHEYFSLERGARAYAALYAGKVEKNMNGFRQRGEDVHGLKK